MTTTKPKKLVMTDFSISEISAVDSPAQKGALVTILKNDSTDDKFKKVSAPAVKETISSPAPRQTQPAPIAKVVPPAAFDKLEDAVAHLVRQGATNVAAMTEARTRYPELFAEMQKRAVPTKKARGFDKAVGAFAELVATIARQDKVGQSAAMVAARKRHPEAFKAAYGERV